eukprot:148056-Pleurochrysis_carterae.AAC.2
MSFAIFVRLGNAVASFLVFRMCSCFVHRLCCGRGAAAFSPRSRRRRPAAASASRRGAAPSQLFRRAARDTWQAVHRTRYIA